MDLNKLISGSTEEIEKYLTNISVEDFIFDVKNINFNIGIIADINSINLSHDALLHIHHLPNPEIILHSIGNNILEFPKNKVNPDIFTKPIKNKK